MSGSRLSLPHFYILLADLRLAAGDQPRALEALRAGRAHIIDTGERFSESELFRFMGRALMTGDAPDPDAATRRLRAGDRRRGRSRTPDCSSCGRSPGWPSTRAGPARRPRALQRVAELCDWFGRVGSGSELGDIVRARRLLSVQQTPS